MTGSHPPNYENYPPPTKDEQPASPEPSGPPEGWTVVPAPLPPPRAAPDGTGRRTLLWVGGVVVVGLVGLPLLAAGNRGEPDPSGATSWAADPGDEDDDDDDSEQYDLDGLTVTAPAGWKPVSSTQHRLVLRNGANTVTFLHYEADQDASAMDEARQQLRRYAADVRNTKEVSASDDSSDDPETAEVVLTGTLDGKGVDVVSSVVITTDDYNAAAVVSVVLTGAADGVRREAKKLRKDFLDQLG